MVVFSRLSLRTKIGLTLIAVGSIFLFLNVLPSRFEAAEKFSYEIDGRPHDQGDVPRICDVLTQKHGEVRISILVEPHSLRNFQNVFQTSDLNAGIRLEIDENGSAGVIVLRRKTRKFADREFTVTSKHRKEILHLNTYCARFWNNNVD